MKNQMNDLLAQVKQLIAEVKEKQKTTKVIGVTNLGNLKTALTDFERTLAQLGFKPERIAPPLVKQAVEPEMKPTKETPEEEAGELMAMDSDILNKEKEAPRTKESKKNHKQTPPPTPKDGN